MLGEPITKTKLMSYVYLKMEHKNQLDRIVELDNVAEIPAMVEGDGSQRSILKTSRVENAIIRNFAQKEKIQQRISEIENELNEIEDAINSLADPMQKEVLRLRYIDCTNCRHTKWNAVSMKIYNSDDEKYIMAIWRIHGHALQELLKLEG